MSSEQKFRTMLEMQIEINDHTVPGWREKNLAWRDAIWTECAELMDHIGWKWWKKQEPNLEQARMELVDIWHFGMSLDMSRHPYNHGNLVDYYCSREYYMSWNGEMVEDTYELIRSLSSCASREDYFQTMVFFKLMNKLGMSLDDLYTMYVGKNVLNKFRQDNGYKEGTYIKRWFNLEDNEVLTLITKALNKDNPEFPSKVYEYLSTEYEAVKAELAKPNEHFGAPRYENVL